MLYGMYVSAAGAMANSYRQEVVTNNLANAETIGFKRDLDDFGVAALAGTSFGKFGEGYLRFSYANSQDNIRKALDRFGEFAATVRNGG